MNLTSRKLSKGVTLNLSPGDVAVFHIGFRGTDLDVLHVDSKFAGTLDDIGKFSPRKLLRLPRYLWQMLRHKFLNLSCEGCLKIENVGIVQFLKLEQIRLLRLKQTPVPPR